MRKVLVCDDTPDILELVQFVLEGEGYAVATVGYGCEVLAAVDAEHPDVVLLDLRMPGFDGLSILKALSARASAPPVVVLSAKSQEDDRQAALSAGARDYLLKPFTVTQLLDAVKRQLL